MKNLKYSLGVDVSAKDLCCCLSVIDQEQWVKAKATRTFANSPAGFKLLHQWVKGHRKEELPLSIVMEATGNYHEQLAWFLYEQQEPVSILLPNRAKKYLQADGAKSKNDTIDAKGLARIGAEKKLPLWVPPSRALYELRSLTRQHQSIREMQTLVRNQAHALEQGQFTSGQIKAQLQQTLNLFEKQLKQLEKAITEMIRKDPMLDQHHANITAISGIGTLAFAVIAAETNGFTLFKNAASLVSYAGYDVVENQSGSRSGKTRISKKGNHRLRRILHMPALTAVRDKKSVFYDLFERVYERSKIKMKAYVAVQKKLLVMAYYLWKKNEKYDRLFNKVAPNKAGATHDEPHSEVLTQ
jgi:transposase